MMPEMLAARAAMGDTFASRQLFFAAAGGCVRSQRTILDFLLLGPDGRSLETLLQSLPIARLVAAGGTDRDQLTLANILARVAEAGDACGAYLKEDYAKEALETLRDLADRGDGAAVANLASVAARFPKSWAEVDDSAGPTDDVLQQPQSGLSGMSAFNALLSS